MSFIRITCWIPIVLWLVLNAYVIQFSVGYNLKK